MLLNLLLIFVLSNVTSCQSHLQRNNALNNALERTTNFFEELKSDYAFKSLNEDILSKINGKVIEHIKNTSFTRYKRKISNVSNRGIDVLNEFQDFDQLNFNNVQDVNFFSLQNKLELSWFAIILDNSKISLYQINNNTFNYVTAYTLANGKQIIVNSCTYEAFLIVQNQDGSILILRFTKVKENYYLYLIQDFESNDITHLAIWKGMNQLYLGIASHSNISVFIWLGDYFDLVQVINHGTDKLIPFSSKGFMYIAATGPTTLIFKYFLKSNEFAVIQRLPSSQDVSSFQLNEGHFMEHYLSLSIESFIIIYKEIHDRFVPFQQISPGRFTVPIILNKAIVLLSLYKDTILIYLYNGWRFVESNIKLSKVCTFRQVTLYGKELLLVKYKNDTWTLKQPIWIKKKSHNDLQEEIRVWNMNAMNITQRALKKIPDSKNSIKILKGNIDQLFVHNINEYNSQALKDVSEQYKKVVSKLQEQKDIINRKLKSNNLTLTSLHAKNIRIKCKTKCKVNRLNIKRNPNLLSMLKITKDNDQILSFKAMNVKEIKNWKCPLFSLPVENIIVNKTINGKLLNDFQENVLKVIGNQEVLGEHTFISMNATDAFVLLNIASYLTKQEIQVREVKVKQLNLTDGGVLLSLNGPPTKMSGSIEASKVKVKGTVHLNGRLLGNSTKSLLPVTIISKLTILNDFVLDNVKIETLRSKDLIANKAGSVKNILSNVVPLHNNVSVSLILSSKRMKWNNVTLHSFQNWITANSLNRVTISGRKHIFHNVELQKSTYKYLKFPEIETPLCGATTIIVPEIKTITLVANNVTVKRLTSLHVFGNLSERYFTQNSTILFKLFNLTGERFYHNVTAKNVSVTYMNNVNLTEMKKLANLWIEPNTLKSQIKVINLIIDTLRSPIQFCREPPKVIKNIISEQNCYTNSVNNVNFDNFLANAINLEDMISLGNITFDNGFKTTHMHTSYLPLNLTQLEENPNLHKKRISGNIETNAINLPYFIAFAKDEILSNIVIKGSATFPTEPIIQNINNIELKELFTRIWMITNFTVFYGKNLHIINALMKGNITLNNSLNILNLENWKNISKRILSKTRLQEITVSASLNSVETPVITSTLTMKSLVSDFNNTFDNALVRHKQQEVKAKWTFNKLNVLGKLHAKKKINNMNLKTDIIRHDSGKNIVTGKKTVVVLTAENVNGLNFNEWASNALMQKSKFVTIKGRKNFNIVTINNINMSGTIMGHNIEEALLKSADQTLYNQKTIKGFFNVSMLVIDGFVNDVNLTDLMNHQLRKQKPLQVIKSRIALQNTLKIIGKLTMNGSYGKVELKNSYKTCSNVMAIREKMRKYSKITEIISVALQNRAIYMNKLEIAKEMNTINVSNENVTIQEERYKTNNFFHRCANDRAMNIILKLNSNDSVLIKSISLAEDEFVIWIKSDSVSIYMCNNTEKSFFHLKDLYIPNIIDAFVESMLHSLWIILRLTSQTLVLHYQSWNDVQKYVLPVTDVFTTSRALNDQLLLLLSDGIWNLEGLATPRNIIEIPLQGKVETLIDGPNYYVKCRSNNNTTLMKARYVGN